MRDQIITKGVAADLPAVSGGIPVCKDYLKGNCRRKSRCKFRHLNSREYDMEMASSFPPAQNLLQTFFEEADMGDRRGPMKRRMMETGGGFEIGPPPQAFMMLEVGCHCPLTVQCSFKMIFGGWRLQIYNTEIDFIF